MVASELVPGQKIKHFEYGEGVIVETPRDSYVRVFFKDGERHVQISSIQLGLTREELIIEGVRGNTQRLKQAWLAYEAVALPLMESAAALTAAKIDVLPHQIVLVHRLATAAPRRYLVADEVGLGKTIETALALRELESRGELKRALMIVPAGLVNNWHRELNEVFNLNFEVFGSEGDVTDRKSNAFLKHDRLIASIDTMKRPERIQRILEAPIWDLVVFDEAHHLTAYRSGGKIKKTENYKLAEALKGHSRDLLLLSATPHQGDHFRFWMLIQLLNPTLFKSPDDMVENRHRLNTVIFRRTKADACKADGSPLFARRGVHTESFLMSEIERNFYQQLSSYLEDGFALAKRTGNQGRGLGFVMAIFQKIAASSFAAVKRTLKRRLLMLTLHEAIIRDRELDIDRREKLLNEAKAVIHEEYKLGDDPVSRSQVDQILADLKLRLVKKIDESELEMASDRYGFEFATQKAEDLAATAVSVALPEERERIRSLLSYFPASRETKVEKLLAALGTLWRQDSTEKVVIFATYLGTVEMLGQAIEEVYPGQGVAVLRGGDHGAKLAAENRFRKKDGPRVLICTAAGREGINLQFARVLFNFDLPWNPMDVEQRIGRIHRYGQQHTAQVYNLVLSDTIEGRVYLLLDDKLREIGKALGKVDEEGNVAEDFRSQILGQLSERLNYDSLYQQALSDPELKRTKVELEAAVSNATEARKVVFELFQDLEGFNLNEYKPFSDVTPAMARLVKFLSAALVEEGKKIKSNNDTTYEIQDAKGGHKTFFTTDRKRARESDALDLIGIDHPLVKSALNKWSGIAPGELGVAVAAPVKEAGILSTWLVDFHGTSGESRSLLKSIGMSLNGQRLAQLEHQFEELLMGRPTESKFELISKRRLLKDFVEPALQRELALQGIASDRGAYSARMISWIEVIPEGIKL